MNELSWENPVKKKLREGKPVFAAPVSVASVETASHLATLGFDFLWVEMEHSPVTLETLRQIALANRGLPAQTFARVPVNELWTAKRVLDAGVTGVIFPFTSTAELARQAVAACRYPPLGKRGSGADLAQACWPSAGNYYDSADANVFVILMIEDAAGVENVEEIAATPGVDALFVGTSDLSFSMGFRGDQDHPLVREAARRVLAAARKRGLPVGRPAFNAAAVKGYIAEGFQFFMAPTEIRFITAGAQQYFDAVR